MENLKAKVEFVEEELSFIGKTFDFLSDKEGDQRKKVNTMHFELLSLQRQKEDYASIV